MRAIHKEWQNKRSGWTRRVRWYSGIDENNIRLCIEDEESKHNILYDNIPDAQADYDDFRKNGVSALSLSNKRQK